jgi:hypothetical protein
VLERPRLFLGQDNHLAGSLCESLEHEFSLGFGAYSGGRSKGGLGLGRYLPTLPESSSV